MEDKRDIYIVSIVSIVAIIGIIVLVLSNAGISGNASKKVSALPDSMDLTIPENGAAGVSLTPTLDWTKSKNADFIVLYIDDEMGFSSPLIQEFQLKKNERAYTVPAGLLQPGTTYYWRVVAYNDAGATTSPRYSFTTAP